MALWRQWEGPGKFSWPCTFLSFTPHLALHPFPPLPPSPTSPFLPLPPFCPLDIPMHLPPPIYLHLKNLDTIFTHLATCHLHFLFPLLCVFWRWTGFWLVGGGPGEGRDRDRGICLLSSSLLSLSLTLHLPLQLLNACGYFLPLHLSHLPLSTLDSTSWLVCSKLGMDMNIYHDRRLSHTRSGTPFVLPVSLLLSTRFSYT